MSQLALADYALLSDCRSAALVSRAGSVDWLCFPRFDGPAVFARILDRDAGHFAVGVPEATATRRYVDQTMALETTFQSTTGTAVLVDAMAVGRNERGHALGAGSPGVLLEGEQGTFLLCSFWLAQALAGELDQARGTFERAVGYANDVGLLAEEVDVGGAEMIGNYPQAFSHIGLVNAAWAITEAEQHRQDHAKGPGEERRAPVRSYAADSTETMEAHMTQVALLLFDAVDLIDVSGPYEVLLTANRLARRRGDTPPFDVVTASRDGRAVTAYGGLGLTPDAALDGIDGIDVLVVPGAIDVDGVLGDPDLARIAVEHARRGALIMSICTGAFVLGAAGLLDGRPFTTHFEDAAELERRVGSGVAQTAVRWVDDGDVITAGGMTSGIAATLHLVGRIAGRDLADATARQMDYVWTSDRGVTEDHR